ncbi:interleukin-27 subunit beta isoform X1 [Xyrichtys novacula]|uniref:Interleukin-27 subunit beta isoform X1 n=1 Tax=Xyrichtys novacula TaxID=13765 RepID=A0AAV1GLH9_XYRNO|nr:interleukin-27 subunit beta isoform X1 [Xyrichtys novacula]
MVSAVCVALTILMSVLGGQAANLLRVSTTSGNPPSIPSVHCWCASYPNMTLCSWPEPSQSPPTHYVATYRERHGNTVTEQCQLIPPGSSSPLLASASSSERLWHCYLPNLKLLTDYIINVTAVYPEASSSHLASFMMEDIVKPDPPVDVQVSPQMNRNLLVEWSPPQTWAYINIFPLNYQILYQWVSKGVTRHVNLESFDNTTVELKGLRPGRLYTFQVCAKELLGLGECSNWSSPVNITIPRG